MMKNIKTLMILIFCVYVLSGCVIYQWAEVTPGLYTAERSLVNGSPQTGTAGVDAVFVDLDHQSAWVMFDNATLRILPFIARARKTWPSGCPSNIQATRMETLDLDIGQIETTSASLQHPVLVRDCPPEPVELVLRDDGNIGGGGMACIGAQTCVVFTWAASTLNLPESMKGYELYSWYAVEDNAWYYTLTTGTNRNKTWEEIAAPESTLTDSDWIKITVKGESALKSVLDRLPEGESVLWIASNAPSTLGDHIKLPEKAVVDKVKTYARKININLTVNE